jgi:hypothetical protein
MPGWPQLLFVGGMMVIALITLGFALVAALGHKGPKK